MAAAEPIDHVRAALLDAQRLGFIGAQPVDGVIAHSRAFVEALVGVTGTVVDLGSGGGIPGLVIAADRPDLHLTLVDRRTARTDVLERVVRRLGWTETVAVMSCDVSTMTKSYGGLFDAAVARGFGPPHHTLDVAASLVCDGGLVVISQPPHGHPWDGGELDRIGVEYLESGRAEGDRRVAVFHVKHRKCLN